MHESSQTKCTTVVHHDKQQKVLTVSVHHLLKHKLAVLPQFLPQASPPN